MKAYLKREIKIINADSFKKRLTGLMFKKNINYGLCFRNCKSIHTFFIKVNIDILAFDKNNNLLKTYYNIKPWKIIVFPKNTTTIYEFPINYIK